MSNFLNLLLVSHTIIATYA